MAGITLQIVLTICGLLATTMWREAEGGATLELKMLNYNNAPEKDKNGECCDPLCVGECDHIFRFSLDRADGSRTNSQSGSIFSRGTSVFQDVNVNDFHALLDMGGVPNPIVTKYQEWPGQILFKLYVQDDDSGFSGNDDVDDIIAVLDLTPQPKATARPVPMVLTGLRTWDRTSLNLEVKLYCDADYYGSRCVKYCTAADSDDEGHYTCNATTGDFVCLPGWKDITNKCLTPVNECTSHKCQHNSTCVNAVGSYTCSCTDGYFGAYCEGVTNPQCNPGIIGRSCDVKVCDFVRCQNGGTCDRGVCKCRTGYTGINCEDSVVCTKRPCQNFGTCVETLYRCECLAGYGGTNCDVPYNATYAPQTGVQPVSSDNFFSSQSGSLLIALIVLVIVLLLILIVLTIFLCLYRRRTQRAEKECTILSRGASSSISQSEKTVLSENFYNGRNLSSSSSVFSGDTDDGRSACHRTKSELAAKEADYAAINAAYTVTNPEYDECKMRSDPAPRPPARPANKYRVAGDDGEMCGDRRSKC